MWVHLHWVPFAEARLQSLLHTSRTGLWRWLRKDTQTLAQLGAAHGYASPRALQPGDARLCSLGPPAW